MTSAELTLVADLMFIVGLVFTWMVGDWPR
jgi:hypothetical protein